MKVKKAPSEGRGSYCICDRAVTCSALTKCERHERVTVRRCDGTCDNTFNIFFFLLRYNGEETRPFTSTSTYFSLQAKIRLYHW